MEEAENLSESMFFIAVLMFSQIICKVRTKSQISKNNYTNYNNYGKFITDHLSLIYHLSLITYHLSIYHLSEPTMSGKRRGNDQ